MRRSAYRSMYAPADHPELNSGGSIGMVDGTMNLHRGQSTLDFLERFFHGRAGQLGQNPGGGGQDEEQCGLPRSGLANNLQLVARLIAGGLPTRVFYVSQGGYDTHTNQRAGQDNRLKELGDAVKAFVDDLAALNALDRVTVMTFSEFGRRVAENGSRGTDHGAAAPMFLIGSKLKPGLLGAEPSLAPADLQDGDIRFNTDFRSVYASLLQEWLRTPSVPILGRQFRTLRFWREVTLQLPVILSLSKDQPPVIFTFTETVGISGADPSTSSG